MLRTKLYDKGGDIRSPIVFNVYVATFLQSYFYILDKILTQGYLQYWFVVNILSQKCNIALIYSGTYNIKQRITFMFLHEYTPK